MADIVVLDGPAMTAHYSSYKQDSFTVRTPPLPYPYPYSPPPTPTLPHLLRLTYVA